MDNFEYLEDYFADIRQSRRTSKKTSKPRTKIRPNTDSLPVATVIKNSRGRYEAILDTGETILCVRARELRDFDIVPGDRVKVVVNDYAKVHSSSQSLCRIQKVENRSTVLKRTADDKKSNQKTVAANVDQCLIISSCKNPDFNYDFINRCVKASLYSNIIPIFCITKSDLLNDMIPINKNNNELLSSYVLDTFAKELSNVSQLSYDEIISQSVISTDTNKIQKLLNNKSTVFVGLSGVGKSTLINRLIPSANRAVGENSKNGDGRHTSSSSCAYKYLNGLIIDTPGIRSFGLGYLNND